MEIDDLIRLADDHGHEIIQYRTNYSPSFAIEDSVGRCHIAMSDELAGAEKMVKLAHEIGHCEYGGFYNYHSPYDVRSRSENRANRWAFQKILPLQEIQESIKSGNDNIWDLADSFNVTPEFLKDALRFYIEQLGKTICPEKRNNV